MGPTMKQFAIIAALFSIVNCLCINNCNQPLRWAPLNETLKESDNVGEYFCRVPQAGGARYGVLNGISKNCDYVSADYGNVISSAIFDVMLGDQSRLEFKWLGASIRPTREEMKAARAVPCHLYMDQDSDCYFGHGVYADGICDEELGVIVPSKRKIFMKDLSSRVSVCAFHRFLVYQ